MTNDAVQDRETPTAPEQGEVQAQRPESDLEARIRKLGWDPERFEEQAKAAIREMNEKQREAAQLRKVADRAKRWMDLIEILDSSPTIALTVLDTVRDHIGPDEEDWYQVGDNETKMADETTQSQSTAEGAAVDKNEIEELKATVAATRAALTLDAELKQLSDELGVEITPEQKVKVLERIERYRGMGSVREHYLAEFGTDLIRTLRGETQSAQTRSEDQSAFPRTTNAEQSAGGGTADAQTAKSIWSLPRGEREKALEREIAKRLKS